MAWMMPPSAWLRMSDRRVGHADGEATVHGQHPESCRSSVSTSTSAMCNGPRHASPDPHDRPWPGSACGRGRRHGGRWPTCLRGRRLIVGADVGLELFGRIDWRRAKATLPSPTTARGRTVRDLAISQRPSGPRPRLDRAPNTTAANRSGHHRLGAGAGVLARGGGITRRAVLDHATLISVVGVGHVASSWPSPPRRLAGSDRSRDPVTGT